MTKCILERIKDSPSVPGEDPVYVGQQPPLSLTPEYCTVTCIHREAHCKQREVSTEEGTFGQLVIYTRRFLATRSACEDDHYRELNSELPMKCGSS